MVVDCAEERFGLLADWSASGVIGPTRSGVTVTSLPDESWNARNVALTGATSTVSCVTPTVLVLVAGSSPMVKSVPLTVTWTASVDATKLYQPFSAAGNQKRAKPCVTFIVGVGLASIEIVLATGGTDW